MQKSGPRTCPKTFLNCFVLNTVSSKAKQFRNVLGRVLGPDFYIQNQRIVSIFDKLEKCQRAYKCRIRTDLNFQPLLFSSSLSSDPYFYSASCVRSTSSVSLQQLKLYSHWGVPPINAVQIRGHKQKEASGGTQWDQNSKIRQKFD